MRLFRNDNKLVKLGKSPSLLPLEHIERASKRASTDSSLLLS